MFIRTLLIPSFCFVKIPFRSALWAWRGVLVGVGF